MRRQSASAKIKRGIYGMSPNLSFCAHLFADIKARSECLPQPVARPIGPGKVPQPVAPTPEVTWVAAVANRIALFSQKGGLGKVHQLFGDKLNTIIKELNETLAA
jgi:hypothetical protein